MRTSTTNDDVYLSILASRAVTALARLAEEPDHWSAAIKSDLEKGLAFCDSIGGKQEIANNQSEEPESLAPILRRLTNEMSAMRCEVHVPMDEVRSKKEFFRQLVTREKRPTLQEITDAMNFFLAATSGYALRKKTEEDLF